MAGQVEHTQGMPKRRAPQRSELSKQLANPAIHYWERWKSRSFKKKKALDVAQAAEGGTQCSLNTGLPTLDVCRFFFFCTKFTNIGGSYFIGQCKTHTESHVTCLP